MSPTGQEGLSVLALWGYSEIFKAELRFLFLPGASICYITYITIVCIFYEQICNTTPCTLCHIVFVQEIFIENPVYFRCWGYRQVQSDKALALHGIYVQEGEI